MPPKKFSDDEDAVQTQRAFFSRELADIPTDELYEQLENLRAMRVSKIQKAKVRAKKEKLATDLHNIEKKIPEKYRDVYRKLSSEQKRQFLLELSKRG